MVYCDEQCVVEIASPACGGFAMTDKTAFGGFAMTDKVYFRFAVTNKNYVGVAMTKISIVTAKLFFCHCEESRVYRGTTKQSQV